MLSHQTCPSGVIMTAMSTAARLTLLPHDAGPLSLRIATDPADRTETPAIPRPRVAIHLGRSVYMVCQRGGQKHRGMRVHGDIDIVPPETPCVWEPNGPDTALIVGIDRELLAVTAEELGMHPGRLDVLNRFGIRDSQIENIGWALKAEMEAGYPTGRIFRDSLATGLAAALLHRHSSFSPVPFASSTAMSGHRLRQALSYIEDNLKQDLSLIEIAQVAGVSVAHLKATFRQTTGLPVHQYVIQRRVEKARLLLSESNLSISQVADETGFAHQSHMATHMRRILGLSPNAIRQLHR
jgi:AraC family transcriptional regulator